MNRRQKNPDEVMRLLSAVKGRGDVTKFCREYGYSRDSYYRLKKRFDKGGELGLNPMSRSRPLYTRRVKPEIEKAILDMAFDHPDYSNVRVGEKLRNQGFLISDSGVYKVWKRHELLKVNDRRRYVDARLFQEAHNASAAQKAALQRLRKDHVENRVGNLVGEYVRTPFKLQGIGLFYHLIFIDSFTGIVFIKFFRERYSVHVKSYFEGHVQKFYESHGVRELQLTTRKSRNLWVKEKTFYSKEMREIMGTHKCWFNIRKLSAKMQILREAAKSKRAEDDEFTTYMSNSRFTYVKLDGRGFPQRIILKRFAKILQSEFYESRLRGLAYDNFDGLQTHLSQWLKDYNEKRICEGKYCYGKTPIEIFRNCIRMISRKASAG